MKLIKMLDEFKQIDFLDLFYSKIMETNLLENSKTEAQIKDFENKIEIFILNVKNTYKDLNKYKEKLEIKQEKSDNIIDVIRKIENYQLNKRLNEELSIKNNKKNKMKI